MDREMLSLIQKTQKSDARLSWGLQVQPLSLLGHGECVILQEPCPMAPHMASDAHGHLCALTLGSAACSKIRQTAKRLLCLAIDWLPCLPEQGEGGK